MVHAIKAGLLIDGHGGDPIKDAVVLVEGKIITAVGPAVTVKIPEGAEMELRMPQKLKDGWKRRNRSAMVI